ncbi:hypothetical protein G9A89_007206 [Geosiphon pyriformis]|nr:hypothetical protein G9A89_007206 [Geosiphon pyriformis]
MATGFTSRLLANACTYFMKALHHHLILCLYCSEVEVSDHTFSCRVNKSACCQLLDFHVDSWRTLSGFTHVFLCVLQLLLSCSSGFSVSTTIFVFCNSKLAGLEIVRFHGLISFDGLAVILVSGLSSGFFADVVKLLGMADAFVFTIFQLTNFFVVPLASDAINTMSTKKLARGAAASSISGSLRQKPKISLGKVKHLGDEADLSYKMPASAPSQYKNMDTSSDEKSECEINKNVSYNAGSESDGQLDSCTNTLKAKHFNSGIVNTLFLDLCDFGSVNMGLSPPVSLRPFHHPVASVKEKLCFEPTKSFALNISLLAVFGSTLYDKLKSVRSLFYKIDGFGSASTLSKFPDIIRTSFISDSSLVLAKQLAVSKNLVVNADLKKISIRSDWEIIIKEILVDLFKLVIESALVKYGKIFSIKIQLIGLWQKALVKFESFQVTDLVVFK